MYLHLPLPLVLLFCSILPLLSAAPTDSITNIHPAESITQATSTTSSSRSSTPFDFTSASASTPPSFIPDSTPTASASNTPQSDTSTLTSDTPFHGVSTPIFTNGPNPTGGQSNPIPSASGAHASHSASVIIILLEALGVLTGVLILLALLRCFYSYRRTPNRDRILALLHRHQLQREMEELERNPPESRRSLVAPPPYVRPPSYPDEHTQL
ncbi:hypothetical protein DFH07DRAFT_941200 [Mycena maculata]|uniref:Uncharacterized protein n=1 Tax=Mycena maculata TaxID=230809 RepID=A0AAD7J136_9AGAR|nr:hypothetical protein DFH07DRAFT_941200 [Mycena maculata]